MRLQKCPTLVGRPMSMTRQGWCFAPSASSSCYAHSSLWASLRFSKSHGLAHETQAMCLLKWKAANGETQPNVWCVRARSSEKGSWPIRTKFFFSANRAETVFNICQMSQPTVKTPYRRARLLPGATSEVPDEVARPPFMGRPIVGGWWYKCVQMSLASVWSLRAGRLR